jgi:hypothetical protein
MDSMARGSIKTKLAVRGEKTPSSASSNEYGEENAPNIVTTGKGSMSLKAGRTPKVTSKSPKGVPSGKIGTGRQTNSGKGNPRD